MPNTLQIKRGLQVNLPTGIAGELLFTSDTKRVYIGDGATNNLLQGASSILTTGMVSFSDSSGKLTGSSSLYWDNTNGRLGIGGTPTYKLDVSSTSGQATSGILVKNSGSGISDYSSLNFANNGATISQIFLTSSTYAVAGLAVIGANGFGHYTNGSNGMTLWADGGILKFVTGSGAGALNTQKMTLFTTGNLAINTTTDAGFKLDVNGTARVVGQVRIGGEIVAENASTLTLSSFNTADAIKLLSQQTFVGSVGDRFFTTVQANFSPTSGTSTFALLRLSTIINQTGGANGITRGLYIAPTLTSAFDFRAIETTAGNVIFNGGNVGIGTSSPAQKLDVNGNTQITGNLIFPAGERLIQYGASSFFAGRDSAGVYLAYGFGSQQIDIGSASTGNIRLRTSANVILDSATSKLLIGTTTDAGYKLDVNGTARIQTSLTLSGTNPVAQIAGSTSYSSYIGGQINGSISGQTIASLYVAYPNYTGTGSSIIGYALMASNSYFDTINVGVTGTGYVGSNVIFNSSTPTLRLMGYNSLTGGSGTGSGTLLLTDRTSGTMLGMSATYGGGGSRLTIFNQYSDGPTSRIKINMAGTDTACFFADGSLQIGNGETTIASAILSASSTTRGFLPPRMTTTQINAIASPAAGLIIFDVTLNKLCVFTTTWETVTSL